MTRPIAVITDPWQRATALNALVGRPYAEAGDGPEAFDCYGLTRHLQALCFGRAMPPFLMPRSAGRFAIAMAIAVHPERQHWLPASDPVDGAIALMIRQDCAFHMGTFFDLDGGIVLHAVEKAGVSADPVWTLKAPGGGRWRIEWHVHMDLAGEAEAA